jgi:hypothetical protein
MARDAQPDVRGGRIYGTANASDRILGFTRGRVPAAPVDRILGFTRGRVPAAPVVQECDMIPTGHDGRGWTPHLRANSGVLLMNPFTLVLGLFLKGERIISRCWGME